MKIDVLFILILILLLTTSSGLTYDVDSQYAKNILEKEGYRPESVELMKRNGSDALIAFQKVHGLPEKSGQLDKETEIALKYARKPKPKEFTKGIHIEVDLKKQLLYVVDGGEVMYILHTSTGRESKTPKGSFNIYQKVVSGWVTAYSPEMEPQGQMYKPLKFYGPFYIHGSGSVPTYPASLGCIRVDPRHMDFLHQITSVGTKVFIY